MDSKFKDPGNYLYLVCMICSLLPWADLIIPQMPSGVTTMGFELWNGFLFGIGATALLFDRSNKIVLWAGVLAMITGLCATLVRNFLGQLEEMHYGFWLAVFGAITALAWEAINQKLSA